MIRKFISPELIRIRSTTPIRSETIFSKAREV